MYRIAFFKLPFMRGGWEVPACPFGDKPINHLNNYIITEVVTSLAFAERQRELYVNAETAATIDAAGANYVYIAQTDSEEIGVYDNDKRPSYWWVDSLEYWGAEGDADPAAVLAISPDVWLTDFFPNAPAIKGRLAQTTLPVATLSDQPRSSLCTPIYSTVRNEQVDALGGDTGFYTVGTFADSRGAIHAYAIGATSFTLAKSWASVFGGAATITATPATGSALEYQVSCTRVYILPATFMTTTDGVALVDTDTSQMAYELEDANAVRVSVYPFSASVSGVGLKRVLDVSRPQTDNFRGLNARAWIMTPARMVELSELRGVQYAGGVVLAASFFVSASSGGDDGIKIYMQVGSELIDVSDDFIADFATNAQSVQQAQQKQLVALQAITGVVGAVGGAVGGVASGNYFGAVQSVAGGVQALTGMGAAKRTPAQIRGTGGAAAFYGFTNTLVLLLALEVANVAEINAVEEEFGYVYDNAPVVEYTADIELDNYYRFTDVIVTNITGGSSAQEELATAFINGVRLKSL